MVPNDTLFPLIYIFVSSWQCVVHVYVAIHWEGSVLSSQAVHSLVCRWTKAADLTGGQRQQTEVRLPGSGAHRTNYQLGNLRQVTQTLCAYASSSLK